MFFGFLLFFIVVCLLLFSMNYFLFSRLAGGLELAVTQRKILFYFLLLLSLCFLLGQLALRIFHLWLPLLIGSIWLGILALGVTVFSCEWLMSRIWPEKRALFTLAALLLLLGTVVFSLVRGGAMPEVRHIELELPGLAPEKAPLVLVQISDLHLGYLVPLSRLEKIVARCNELQPDILVITGDLVDGDPGRLGDFASALSNLRSRYGVFMVTGNHEFYSGIEKFEEMAGQARITLLRNESLVVGEAVELIGLDDDHGKRMGGPGPADLDDLNLDDTGLPRILLYHQPLRFDRHVSRGVNLQLSGHTHAGQIPPLDLLVFLSFRRHYGLFGNQNAWIYTSSGAGTWGPPMRLFSRNEIVRFVLRSGD